MPSTQVWFKSWCAIAGLAGAAAVALGAYATHGLSGVPADMAELGSRYALIHALALLGVAVMERTRPQVTLHLAGALFVAGIVCFSGSLAALGICGLSHAPLAPVGGSAFILGWLCLTAAALFGKSGQ